MMKKRNLAMALLAVVVAGLLLHKSQAAGRLDPARGRPALDLPEDYFPLGIFFQQPTRLDQYRAIGINLWMRPNGEMSVADLERFRQAGVRVIPALSEGFPVDHAGETVIAWALPGEPDNARLQPDGSWGACASPEEISKEAERVRTLDSTRPLFLNFGRGVALPDWVGRGSCKGNHEDWYPAAMAAVDIVSFDVYPVFDGDGQLELVAKGMRNLGRWAERSGGRKTLWAAIEVSAIGGGNPPTPSQVRSQVWMAIINGARGIFYFPWQVGKGGQRIREDALFAHPDLVAGLATINAEVSARARVLNTGRPLPVKVRGKASAAAFGLAGRTYVFAVSEAALPGVVRLSGLQQWPGELCDDAGRRWHWSPAGIDLNLRGYEVALLETCRVPS